MSGEKPHVQRTIDSFAVLVVHEELEYKSVFCSSSQFPFNDLYVVCGREIHNKICLPIFPTDATRSDGRRLSPLSRAFWPAEPPFSFPNASRASPLAAAVPLRFSFPLSVPLAIRRRFECYSLVTHAVSYSAVVSVGLEKLWNCGRLSKFYRLDWWCCQVVAR